METITSTSFEETIASLPEAQRALAKQIVELVKDTPVIVIVETLTNLLCVIGVEHDQLVQIRAWFNETIDINIAVKAGKQGKADA